MELVTKNVQVTKEASEMADALVELVKSVKKHSADGFQAGQDLPAIVMENLNQLMKGVEGVDKLGAEAKGDLTAFINAWVLSGTEVASLFLEKESVSGE